VGDGHHHVPVADTGDPARRQPQPDLVVAILEDRRHPLVEQVLGDVEVVLHQRHARAVETLDHDGAHVVAGLDAVGRHPVHGEDVGVDLVLADHCRGGGVRRVDAVGGVLA
jgi:hypothetical protein